MPVRIELGPRDMEKGQFVAVRRDTSAKMTLKIDTAVVSVTKLLDDIHDNMYTKYGFILTISYDTCLMEQIWYDLNSGS